MQSFHLGTTEVLSYVSQEVFTYSVLQQCSSLLLGFLLKLEATCLGGLISQLCRTTVIGKESQILPVTLLETEVPVILSSPFIGSC